MRVSLALFRGFVRRRARPNHRLLYQYDQSRARRRDSAPASLSASSDLAKRPHAPVRTTRGARPPGLLCLVFWYPPRRPRSIGRRLRRFGNGFCECDAGFQLVLVETTAFVFATGAATTGFVASEPSNRRFIHPQCASLRRRKLTSDRRRPSAADLATAPCEPGWRPRTCRR
jgi:hypothetical protein